jgi:hypothetical protein
VAAAERVIGDTTAAIANETIDELVTLEQWLNVPRLKSLLLAREVRLQTAKAAAARQTVASWLGCRSKDVAEDRIIQHYYGCWLAVANGDGPRTGREYVRALIYAHCVTALREIQVDESRAIAAARSAVELADGEQVLNRGIVLAGRDPQ